VVPAADDDGIDSEHGHGRDCPLRRVRRRRYPGGHDDRDHP